MIVIDNTYHYSVSMPGIMVLTSSFIPMPEPLTGARLPLRNRIPHTEKCWQTYAASVATTGCGKEHFFAIVSKEKEM